MSSKKTKIEPLGTRVLVQPMEQDNKTASGLLLPETAKEKPQSGEVVAVGTADEMLLKAGDRVLFARYSGTEFKMDGVEYLLMDMNDILARLN